MPDPDRLNINTLRFLAVDAIEAAQSGHPGLVLGAAPMAYLLWDRFLRFNPAQPDWPNRDRFVLSAGHGSMLLYGLLHLYGYDLPLSQIKRFRQWSSLTPGHPEQGHTPGVETTTGPLGQGFANGVGMAAAELFLRAKYNRPGYPIIDHYTYGLVSDGDLMEGLSSEAASLAGHWGLGKLIYLYDDNRISIDGSTDLTFSEDVGRRFQAQGWHVQRVADGNDLSAIEAALKNARAETGRPSLIRVRTHIGYGSPKQDSAASHGAPLGPEAARAAKEQLGWPQEPLFHVPEEVRAHCRRAVQRGSLWEAEWKALWRGYSDAHPQPAAELEAALAGRLPSGWDRELPSFSPDDGPLATRTASGQALNALAARIPNFIGGSADLSPSNKTLLSGRPKFSRAEGWGPNIHFGVREHAMAAILNGLALHGGLHPYAGTFLIFCDYMRPALRLAALMQTHSLFIFTHDTICVGEDGPTHQPVEQVMTLRALPGLTVIRPADANEAVAAWRVAVRQPGPAALIFTRQKLPILDPSRYPIAEGVPRGAYLLAEPPGDPAQVTLIGTGSEVHLALAARQKLHDDHHINARVVSMPSWELFEAQPADYRAAVLPPGIPRLAIEAGITLGWHKWVGSDGDVLGLDRFGASAPGPEVYEKLGFTVAAVVARARVLVEA